MKILSFSLLLFFLLPNAFGQVSGKLSTVTGQPVPYANVILLRNTDTSVVKTGLTDENGFYQIENIPAGKYILRITSIGYRAWESSVFELTGSQPGKNFETQVMTEDKKQLDEVVVRSERPLYQQRPEGVTVNVESSVLTKGSSVLEVLERSPGVIIDRRNNDIILNGKSGVLVMLNGKPMRMSMEQMVNLLNGMNANDIEKIELLTTPPSMYDAEGSAGMINIVTKKNKKRGTNGSFSLTGGYGWGEKANASINLAHNTRKMGLYGSYSFLHDRTYSNIFITSSQDMPVFGGRVDVVVWDTTHATQNNHDVTLGFDMKLNAKTTIGSSIIWNNSARSSNDFNWATYNVLPDSLLFYQGYIHGTNRWKNLISSFYVEKNIRDGERINFDVDYLYFKNNNPSAVQSYFVNKDGTPAGNNDSIFSPDQRGFAHTTIQVGVIKADYTKQLSKKLKLEMGVKGTYTKSASESGIESLVNGAWTSRSETIDNIIMKEGIGAGYASVNAQINQVTSLVIGTRYEYAFTKMDNPTTKKNLVDRRLGVIFPTILVSRKLNDDAALQFSWTKRISRPSYNDLASFVRYSDPSAVYTGNPLLKPTITNNVKVGYNYRRYTFSMLFSRDEYPIARYQITESPQRNLLYVSPQNLGWQKNITFQTNLPFTINNWWNMNYSFVGGWRRFKVNHTRQPFEKSYFTWAANFNQSFKLPRRFLAEVSGWYNSSFYNGTIKVDGMGALNAGIKKELNNNRGTFQLSATDLLRTMKINVHYGTLTKEAFDITNNVVVNIESRVFPVIKLTYTRSFGTATTMSRKKQNVSDEERDRIRKDE